MKLNVEELLVWVGFGSFLRIFISCLQRTAYFVKQIQASLRNCSFETCAVESLKCWGKFSVGEAAWISDLSKKIELYHECMMLSVSDSIWKFAGVPGRHSSRSNRGKKHSSRKLCSYKPMGQGTSSKYRRLLKSIGKVISSEQAKPSVLRSSNIFKYLQVFYLKFYTFFLFLPYTASVRCRWCRRWLEKSEQKASNAFGWQVFLPLLPQLCMRLPFILSLCKYVPFIWLQEQSLCDFCVVQVSFR